MVRGSIIVAGIATVAAQKSGSLTEEKHPKLNYQECTSSGCKTVHSEITIDSNWRWTHKNGEATNCYTGNLWDGGLCPDAKTCTKNCQIEGADKEYEGTYGIKTSGGDLELGFVTHGPYTTNIGSRVYLMNGEDKYKMFNLKNKEFTYTVDDSDLGCGLNGALYFVAMDEDGGASKYKNAGAKYGLGYCDAQCPHDLKWINGEANVAEWVPSDVDVNAGKGKYGTCCTEIDIWEANKIATAFTMHSCEVDEQTRCEGVHCGDAGNPTYSVGAPARFQGVCDKNGCDIQAHRLGTTDFFGPGSDFTIDSTKPVTVTTQFITEGNTDHGKLKEVKQIYSQNGKTIEHSKYTVHGKQHNTISDEFCADWVADTQDGSNFLDKGAMDSVDKAFSKGVVLVMSLWDDHDANMLWLDSTYPTDGKQHGSHRGSCPTTSGVPADIEKSAGDSKVKFSDIKWGAIGSTGGGSGSFSCDECAAHGFGEDKCDCGYCSSFGGCGYTCGKDSSHPAPGPQCEKVMACSECEASGYGADQCGCGYCGSFGGCGFTCGHDSSKAPLGPKCTIGSVEV